MTEEQKKYYNAMKKLGSKKPQKPIPRPQVCPSPLQIPPGHLTGALSYRQLGGTHMGVTLGLSPR